MKPVLVLFALAVAGIGVGVGAEHRAGAQAIQAPHVDYRLHVLANGLKVYSVVDHATPNVTVQVWYGVGAKNDPPGRSGFAHLFEHLMFKGTRDMPPEYMSRLTEDVGGNNNASTDSDFTEYHEVIPAGHLERLLWAEAERMSSLVVEKTDFVAERAVVEQELRERTLSDPYGRLFAFDIPEASFTVHPYRRAPIGSIDDLESATLDDVKAFHALYYRPDNANLIVVGDFDPQKLDAWVDRYFGPIPRPAAPIPQITAVEPPRTTPRTVDAYGPDAPMPAVVLTYAAPKAASPDAAALEVLNAVLTQGKSSRLSSTLVYGQQLAAQVFSDADLRQQAGLIDVGAVLAGGKTLQQGEAALRAALVDLQNRPITAAELTAAKNQLLTGLLQDRETIDGLASQMGQAIVVEGDAAHINTDMAALQAVTAADVQRVARAYLVDNQRVTIRYYAADGSSTGGPGAVAAIASPPAPAATLLPRTQQVADAVTLPPGQRHAPPATGASAPVVMPRPAERTLPNGLRVIVAHTSDLPLATALLTVRGGASLDPAGKAGLAEITATLAGRGAGGRSAPEIAARVETLGDTFTAEADYDSSSLSLTGLATSLADGLPILADIARRPSFSEAELRRVRRETLDGLSLSMQDPDQLTDFAVAPLVFGKGPYGHAMGGLPRSLARITRADIVRQHARLYRPDNAILILTGDVDPETGFALAERAFGDWAKPAGAPPLAAVNGPAPRGRTIVINLPGADEATVTVAGRSIGRLDPAYYAVEVANSMLGGGYSSRLNTEIRIKRGLSYDAGSQVDERYRTGLFSATAQTDNASAPEVAGLMLAQLLTLGATAPPADELAARKAALIGEFGRDAETSADMADLLADDAVYGVPLEELARYPQRIEAVTSAEAQAAAGRLADAPRTDVLIVGDARRFLPALRRRFAKIQVVSAGKLKLDSPSLR